MAKTGSRMRASIIAALLALCAATAQAQLARTFVSANGSDTANCGRATPCRSLQVAHDNTIAGGEINMLDPAGYGTVTITKAISILNDGVGSAGVLVPAGAIGITINAAAGDRINLRGLIIEGSGVGVHGIQFHSGKSLVVTNCVIRHLAQNGIDFVPNGTSSLAVSSTLIGDNGNIGVILYPSGAGAVNADFDRLEVYNNGNHGVFVSGGTSTGTVAATAIDSTVARNVNGGFIVSLPGTAATSLQVVRSVSANNGVGLYATGGANSLLRVGQSAVSGNGFGWLATTGGILLSYGDNNIEGNGNGESPPPVIARK